MVWGETMKKQHLFTLDIPLVQRLHREVARGYRSQFVEKAIKNRLNSTEDFNAGDISDRQIMASLLTRLSDRDDAAALMVREFLLAELA